MMAASSSPRSKSQRNLWIGLGIAAVVVLCGCLVVGLGGGVALYLNRNQHPAVSAVVEYVLDASPRMAQPGTTGAPRLTVARGVLADVIRPADPAVVSGLRVFGSGAVLQSCQDTDLLVPLAPSSQKLIADKSAALEASQSADSALSQAIVAAIRDLASKKGTHSLVVVTGGADSCNPNAGQVVAQEAQRSGIDLETYVVGFGVSDSEAQAIKVMLAQAPKARYLDAKDEASLRTRLRGVQDRIEHPASAYTGQSACDYSYEPLRKGATWTYVEDSATYTETVTAVTAGPSQTTATESYRGGGYMSQTYKLTCGPNGIVGLQVQNAAAGQGGNLTMVASSGSTLGPPSDLAPGATWHYTATYVGRMTPPQGGQPVSVTTTMVYTYTAVGVETVTVPAGTFDAIRVDSVSTTVTDLTPVGLPAATSTGSGTDWYARGVGEVKWTVSNALQTLFTDELAAYSVPGLGSAAATKPQAAPGTGAAASPTKPAPSGLLSNIPAYPGGTVDNSRTEQGPDHASLNVRTGDALNRMYDYYDQTLKSQGWSEIVEYFNFHGGPQQLWMKGNMRLWLVYLPESTPPLTTVTASLTVLDPAKARSFLPAEFPLPDGAEFTYAGYQGVGLFVRQDYATVAAFYQKQQAGMTGRGWKVAPGKPTRLNFCVDSDCTPNGSDWPAGSTPIPMPTEDSRGATALVWTAPDKDDFAINIYPLQDYTLVQIDRTLRSGDAVHLPSDVPVYKDADVTTVDFGTMSFYANDSVDVVTKFYDDALTSAGYQTQSTQNPKTWKKGNVEITVDVKDSGGGESTVTLKCAGCTAP